MKNNFRNLELDEYLASTLKDAGYGDVEVQKTPIGTRITLYVTRPGLVIGRKGTGIKDLTTRLEEKFGLTNPQISVLEVSVPELNPKIMCNRIAQLIERGTAFRRADHVVNEYDYECWSARGGGSDCGKTSKRTCSL